MQVSPDFDRTAALYALQRIVQCIVPPAEVVHFSLGRKRYEWRKTNLNVEVSCLSIACA